MKPTNAAVAYVRVSTKPQGEKYSPEIQWKAITAYAKKHDLQIVKKFEEAKSGWALKARVDFYKMLEFMTANKVRNVIYYLTSRISRNDEDWQDLKVHKAIMHNVSKDVSFDLNKKEDWRLIIAEQQELLEGKKSSHQNSEYATVGMQAAAERGEYPGQIPLGYKAEYEQQGGKRRIVIDPKAGPLIRRMFELYSSGDYTIGEITKKMRDLGLRSKMGHKVSLSAIDDYLRKPFYYGYFLWKGKLYKGTYQPLITKALFDETMNVLHRKSNRKGPAWKKFRYGGLLRCALCGHAIVGETQTKVFKKTGTKSWTYYHCAQPKSACPGHSTYTEKKIDSFFDLAFNDLWWDDASYEKLRQRLEQDYHCQAELEKQELAAQCQELTEVKAKIDRGLDLILSGKVDPELLTEKHQALKHQQAEIEGRIADLEAAATKNIDELFEILVSSKDLINKYLQASPEIRRKLHSLMFITIQLGPRISDYTKEETRQPLYFHWKEPFASIFGNTLWEQEIDIMEDEYLKTQTERA
jgi:DNA invertase Pin-like site-specific DNA recombinase